MHHTYPLTVVYYFQRHEPDSILRENCFLSFEGFAKYLMDKDNYAYIYEKTKHNDEVKIHTHTHLGDNCIQNFHTRRYIVGYTVGNLVLR